MSKNILNWLALINSNTKKDINEEEIITVFIRRVIRVKQVDWDEIYYYCYYYYLVFII